MPAGMDLYLPAVHVGHDGAVNPSPELYEPAEQVVERQALALLVPTYLAWVQSEHALALTAEKVPAEQAAHVLLRPAPRLDEKEPAVHAMQV